MIRNWSWQAGLSIGFAIPALLWANDAMAQLQPVADDTLGAEQSLVTPTEINGVPGHLITEGAQRGANLFHSFQDFSIDAGRAAYFANPDGVENILGRVTGGEGSEILGRLGVLGEANLFLVNPNGIVFGPNSSLDIGGYVGTVQDDDAGDPDYTYYGVDLVVPIQLNDNTVLSLGAHYADHDDSSLGEDSHFFGTASVTYGF